MTRILRREPAKRDLIALWVWYAENASLDTADRFLAATEATLAMLTTQPHAGLRAFFMNPELQEMRRFPVTDGFRENPPLLLSHRGRDRSLGAERKAMIESLATIGEQATLPEERRRVDVVKTCLKSLADGVRVSADAAKAWEVFGPTIASYFHLAFDSLT